MKSFIKKITILLLLALVIGLESTTPAMASGAGVGKGAAKSAKSAPTTIELIDRLLTTARPNDKFVRVDDMLVPVVKVKAYQKSLAKAAQKGQVGTQSAFYFSATLWPGGNVPYVIEDSLSSAGRTAFESAIREWEKWANLHFFPRTTEANYMRVYTDPSITDRSFSSVGMAGGAQPFMLAGWATKSTACHELGHALGLMHEQCRSDRDKYVIINWSNILDNAQYAFALYPDSRNQGAYDFNSIMHYHPYSFALNSSVPTIICKPGYTQYQNVIGYGTELSDIDKSGMAALYGAPGSPLTSSLSGVVRSKTGIPIVGASVQNISAGTSTSTDSNGRYTFSSLMNGAYNLFVTASGYQASYQFSVLPSANADFILTPTLNASDCTVSGRVVRSGTDIPVTDAQVALSGAVSATTTTDSNGNYTLHGLPYGVSSSSDYTVTVSHNGYQSTSSGFYSYNINIVLNFSLAPIGYGLSGKVTQSSTGTALVGATITLDGMPAATTNASGSYAIDGLASGTYSVAAAKTGYNGATQQVTVSSGNLSNINFSLAQLKYSISGRVTETGTGAGIVGVTIALDGTPTTITDATGGYSIAGVTLGNYTVTASKSGYAVTPVSGNSLSLPTSGTAISPNGEVNFSAFFDSSPPVVAITTPSNGSTQYFTTGSSVAVTATGTATDASGVASLSFMLTQQKGRKLQYYNWTTLKWTTKTTTPGLVYTQNTGGSTSVNWSRALPKLPKGTYTLTVWGIDTLGQESQGSADVTSTFFVAKAPKTKPHKSPALSPSVHTS